MQHGSALGTTHFLALALLSGLAVVAAARRARGSRRAPPAGQTRHAWVRSVGFSRTFAREIEVAVDLALRCGDAMRSTLDTSPSLKDGEEGIDPVTATDIANENLVTTGLSSTFPQHAVIGEEAAAAAGRVPPIDQRVPTWVVDPIDGTSNFVHGLPLSCVSIGLCVGGKPALGVVYDPWRDELYVGVAAERKAFCNGEPIRPSARTRFDKAMVLTDNGYERSAAGIARISAATDALLSTKVVAKSSNPNPNPNFSVL